MKKGYVYGLIIVIIIVGVVFAIGKRQGEEAVGGINTRFRTTSSTEFFIGTSSVLIAPTSTSRTFLRIDNHGLATITIEFINPAIVNQGFEISAPGSYEFREFNSFVGSVHAISGTANQSVTVTEFKQ